MNRRQWEIWIWTCIFALLPLLFELLLGSLVGVSAKERTVDATRELLFFTFTISTLSLSDLRNATTVIRNRTGYESRSNFSIIAALTAVAFYGVQLGSRLRPINTVRFFAYSGGVALIGLFLATEIQNHIRGASGNEQRSH
jgi:hypothetical protein